MSEREEKKAVSQSDEKRYAILSKESVKLMSEAAGHEDIHDTVAGILGEDVSYRLREISQKSAQFMRHSKRKRMSPDDFNKACRFSDIQPVLGHCSADPAPPFLQVKLEQGETIHCFEDPATSLASVSINEYLPKQLGETTIKAHWLAVEGVQKTVQNPQGTPGNKVEPNGPLMKYLDKISQSVLGNDAEMLKTALTDLRTNSKISPILPHLVSFISNGVKTLSHNMHQLQKLLYSVRSLVCNSTLFLEAQPYLPGLTQSVQHCLLEPLSSNKTLSTSSCDHWLIRDTAARLLAQIVRVWGNSVNHMERFTEKTLREVLYDHSKPFASHYGAVMGLVYLGTENVERVLLPHLNVYLPHLFATMEYQGLEFVGLQADAYKVHGAIMLGVELALKKYIKDFKDEHIKDPSSESAISQTCKSIAEFDNKMSKPSSTSGFISMFNKSPVGFYLEMAELFGDSLTLKFPEMLELKSQVFIPSVKEIKTSISDPEANKSGEELLEELEEAVKQEENVKKEEDRKRCERVKQDLEEKNERWRKEKERRAADHRQQLQMVYQRKLQDNITDSDNEIEVVDVEGDSDKSGNPYYSNRPGVSHQGNRGLAFSGTIGSVPGQGIKLTFNKKSKLSPASAFFDSPSSDFTEIKDRDTGGRKRKQSSISPDEDFEFLGAAGFTGPGLFFPGSDPSKASPSKYRKKEGGYK